MAVQRVIVTGGTGKARHWIVKRPVERRHGVVHVDIRQPEQALCRALAAEQTELGPSIGAFSPPSTADHTPDVSVSLPDDTNARTPAVGEATAALFHRRDGTPIPSYPSVNRLRREDHERDEARCDHPEEHLLC